MQKMPEKIRTLVTRARRGDFFLRPTSAFIVFAAIIFAGCTELQKTAPEPFFAVTPPPPIQEFRWSNGKLPKSLDPAEAAAPPETDITRAIYEGLTEVDPRTLEARPAAAESWESSDDKREWTFHLRTDAKWSNGDDVNAEDFVRSWKRLAAKAETIPHKALLINFADLTTKEISDDAPAEAKPTPNTRPNAANTSANMPRTLPANNNVRHSSPTPTQQPLIPELPRLTPIPTPQPTQENNEKSERFAIEAVDERTVRIHLKNPDPDLPELVANPIFLPVHKADFDKTPANLNADLITNGPFTITETGENGITLVKAEYYWGRENIKLDRVRFIPVANAEQALMAYRSGEVDVVTNTNFEPLVLKLLAPFDDFRRTRHAAINFYEVNRANEPFNDRRVREAMAIAIERERLTEGEMEGTTQPAFGFLPFDETGKTAKIVQDTARARTLLVDAGFPNGEGFPVIRLVVNRNDAQQRIARSVATMWKQNLNLETDIIVKDTGELQAVRESGEFDLIRRGSVFPTTDELANFAAIFGFENLRTGPGLTPTPTPTSADADDLMPDIEIRPIVSGLNGDGIILSDADAIYELHGIPLYFSMSYSLVKPYVNGFELNALDAPSLKDVTIDSSWQPNGANAGS